MNTGAEFSECGLYRYGLYRYWGRKELGSRVQMWLMLNPSTADSVMNDPTVERCVRRANAAGFDGVYVCNLFAYRSTDPAALKSVADPIGPKNDSFINGVAHVASQIVCAWGAHGSLCGRAAKVLEMLRDRDLFVLGLTSKGEPKHPLYVSYTRAPYLWHGRSQPIAKEATA